MNYNSLIFGSFCFIFVFLYAFMPGSRSRRYLVFGASCAFYIYAGIASFVIVLLSAITVYFMTNKIRRIYEGFENEKKGLSTKEQITLFAKYKIRTKKYLVLTLFILLAVWTGVKVGKLIRIPVADTALGVLRGELIIPLGISYYSLSAIGYTLDVYWRKTKAEGNFCKLFAAMIYFPHIVQGPISRYQKIMGQMENLPKVSYERLCFGLQLMVWGYMKKLVVADRLAIYVNTVLGDLPCYAGISVWIAVVFSLFQIYADFSGCMDIVQGISEIIGIELDSNFRQPFFSKSAQEYWRRWHITLGAWFKDYVYMPIVMAPGFMRKSNEVKKRYGRDAGQIFNTIFTAVIIWILTGLWHGTGWNYMIWGIYWYVLIVVSALTKNMCNKMTNAFHIDRSHKIYLFWESLRTFLIADIGRIWVIGGSIKGCIMIWKSMFGKTGMRMLSEGNVFGGGLDVPDFLVAILGIAVILFVDYLHEKKYAIREMLAGQPLVLRWAVYYAAVFVIVVFGIYGPEFVASSFAYGAF